MRQIALEVSAISSMSKKIAPGMRRSCVERFGVARIVGHEPGRVDDANVRCASRRSFSQAGRDQGVSQANRLMVRTLSAARATTLQPRSEVRLGGLGQFELHNVGAPGAEAGFAIAEIEEPKLFEPLVESQGADVAPLGFESAAPIRPAYRRRIARTALDLAPDRGRRSPFPLSTGPHAREHAAWEHVTLNEIGALAIVVEEVRHLIVMICRPALPPGFRTSAILPK